MAKGLGVHGNARGKVGNLVGSVLNGQQVWRSYQPQVRNPKTLGQVAQRIKLQAASTFYSMFDGLLDHSWQGVPYGNRSRLEFMRRALSADAGYPYIVKGDKSYYPGMYPMSSGSLSTVVVDSNQTFDSCTCFGTSLRVENYSGVGTTFRQFVESLIAGTPGLVDGDQLTICEVYDRPIDGVSVYVPVYRRIVLALDSPYENVESTDTWFDVQTEVGQPHVLFGVGEGGRVFVGLRDTGTQAVSCAVIVSRRSGSSWLRSNSSMWLLPLVRERLMSGTLYQSAIDSYMDGANSVNSPWYLNRGNAQSFPGKVVALNGIVAGTATTYMAGLDSDNRNVVVFTTNGTATGSLIGIDGNPMGAPAGSLEGGVGATTMWFATFMQQFESSNQGANVPLAPIPVTPAL